jgi:hypothetical protein
MMKPLLLLANLGVLAGLTSCGDFFVPYEEKMTALREREARLRDATIRPQFWESQSVPVAEPVLEKVYIPITIPEHTLPDGTVIETHIEYVEIVK